MVTKPISFTLPEDLHASTPPERRGIRRDHVKMMVLDRFTGKLVHDCFYNLDQFLKPGDLIVLNSSRTIPANLKATIKREEYQIGANIEVRLARCVVDSVWEVYIVSDGIKPGDTLFFSATLTASVIEKKTNSALFIVCFSKTDSNLLSEIYSIGEPIRYEYIHVPWELEAYQTVYASHPGSVEMPSAGRAFTWEMLFKLQRKGIQIAFLQLHTGLSYLPEYEWHHGPEDNQEAYHIPVQTMEAINQTKASGGRIIAVGTTVVRALETAACTSKLEGWTNLYIDATYQLRVVDGIISGFHEPEASHLDMLTAFIDEGNLLDAYQEAVSEQYLWHEFGDIHVIF